MIPIINLTKNFSYNAFRFWQDSKRCDCFPLEIVKYVDMMPANGKTSNSSNVVHVNVASAANGKIVLNFAYKAHIYCDKIEVGFFSTNHKQIFGHYCPSHF